MYIHVHMALVHVHAGKQYLCLSRGKMLDRLCLYCYIQPCVRLGLGDFVSCQPCLLVSEVSCQPTSIQIPIFASNTLHHFETPLGPLLILVLV